MEKHETYKVGVRRKTRQVNVGGVKIGGDAPVSVQTMTKTKTDDIA
jgi:(E)-4-hydroxy-3-methylbut-2-enyl-diphosphate synthase